MKSTLDLKTRARQAMLDAGFHPDFPADVLSEVKAFRQKATIADTSARDLRSLLWSSIDNDTSRDLDQVEYTERLTDGSTRLLIGIADVDTWVTKGSGLDRRAADESTSVYAGAATFPMLPTELSTDMSSLLDGQDRLSIIIEMRVLMSGEVIGHEVYPGWLRNCAKLAYSTVGDWLEGRGPVPTPVAAVPGMEQQIRFQLELSQKLRALRRKNGALTFGAIEATPVFDNGQIKDMKIRQHSVAEDIIESFMVAANVAMAQYLRNKRALAIRRVVRTPKHWDGIQAIAAKFGVHVPATPDPRALSDFLAQRQSADPLHFPELSLSVVKLLGPGEYLVETPGLEHEGHFGLAVQDYTHSTAPNRRYADLVTQRLLKSASLSASGPYTEPELAAIATHCTDRENAARKVERLMRKVAAATLLVSRIGESFDGVITGASDKGTYVRLLGFPAEGRIIRGAQGAQVGDKLKVRLVSVDVDKGFIDFEKI
jgi:exoribonuclease-2